MSYYLDLFSAETSHKFSQSDRTVSGFRVRHRNAAARVKAGDKLVCYLTKLSRWIGILEVQGSAFEDATPRFTDGPDPFLVRFKVKPIVLLPPEHGLSIHDPAIWSQLSLTKDHTRSSRWTGFFRTSLNRIPDADGIFLERVLIKQLQNPKVYPLDDADQRALAPLIARRPEGAVTVIVPEDLVADEESPKTARESIKVQALLARLGSTLGYQIWLPANDRGRVLKEWPDGLESLLKELPLHYDRTTLGTIERIDVLWLKKRWIARAFEIEDTTAIYSGLLRMADLISLQPNMDIKLHIVAPEARRTEVLDEIRRPVFSLLEGRPLGKICTYLSYDSIREIVSLPKLTHMSDSVLEDYAEEAE
jgi:hypothetical protein